MRHPKRLAGLATSAGVIALVGNGGVASATTSTTSATVQHAYAPALVWASWRSQLTAAELDDLYAAKVRALTTAVGGLDKALADLKSDVGSHDALTPRQHARAVAVLAGLRGAQRRLGAIPRTGDFAATAAVLADADALSARVAVLVSAVNDVLELPVAAPVTSAGSVPVKVVLHTSAAGRDHRGREGHRCTGWSWRADRDDRLSGHRQDDRWAGHHRDGSGFREGHRGDRSADE